MGKMVSRYDGYPKTRRKYDDHEVILEADVSVAALSPFRKLIADKLRWVVGVTACVASVVEIYHAPIFEPEALIAPPLAFIGGVIFGHFAFSRILKIKKKFHFNRDTFVVKGCLWNRTIYDRHEKHRFILKEHPLAKNEAWWIELFKAHTFTKKLSAYMRPYFGESYLLCIEFGGQRKPLMSIHGKTKADLVLGRFIAIDEDLDSSMAGSGIHSTNSKHQTKDGIGGLKPSF